MAVSNAWVVSATVPNGGMGNGLSEANASGLTDSNRMKQLAFNVLQILKWPVAVISLLCLPAIALSCWNLVSSEVMNSNGVFWIVAVVSTILGWVMCTRFRVTRFLTTMEHEFIHVLLAWATGLRVYSLKAESDGSGLAMIETPFNWLVALGPYFIPFALYLYALLGLGMGIEGTAAEAFFGMIFGYEMVANIRESHPHQTDFQIAGKAFTLCFLPTAMLLSYGGAFAFLTSGELSASWSFMMETSSQAFFDTWNWIEEFVRHQL